MYTIDMSAKQDSKVLFALGYYSNSLLQKVYQEAFLSKVLLAQNYDGRNDDFNINFDSLEGSINLLSNLMKIEFDCGDHLHLYA